MKIAIIGPYFFPQVFGIEKVMYHHASLLAQRGHEVHVITSNLKYPDGMYLHAPMYEEHRGFTIHRLKPLVRSIGWPFCYPSNGGLVIPGLDALITRLGPDVLHAHNVGAPAWANAAARFASHNHKRFFYSPYYHPDKLKWDRFRKFLYHRLNQAPISNAHAIFHQTKLDYDLFQAEFPRAKRDSFVVLANGITPPCYSRTKRRESTQVDILFVGRVDDPRKGFSVLEATFQRLISEFLNLTLTVVGEISPATQARLQAKFGSSIRILGPITEEALEREYAASDLFVMPSLYEGFGMPFIEAMRYAVPVIGTTVGGIPEVVPRGTGVLVPPNNPEHLLEAMHRLIIEPHSRLEMGQAGLEWSKNYHWPRIVDQLEARYTGENVEDSPRS